MKLLFCIKCSDVVRLSRELRKCKCGKVAGFYLNKSIAIVNGEGRSLVIDNHSISQAFFATKFDGNKNKVFNLIAYMRPHEGETNPNTRVIKNIEEAYMKTLKGEKI